jgi:FKBP-type peptidyl-prolyl cis-trans isomerase 2
MKVSQAIEHIKMSIGILMYIHGSQSTIKGLEKELKHLEECDKNASITLAIPNL